MATRTLRGGRRGGGLTLAAEAVAHLVVACPAPRRHRRISPTASSIGTSVEKSVIVAARSVQAASSAASSAASTSAASSRTWSRGPCAEAAPAWRSSTESVPIGLGNGMHAVAGRGEALAQRLLGAGLVRRRRTGGRDGQNEASACQAPTGESVHECPPDARLMGWARASGFVDAISRLLRFAERLRPVRNVGAADTLQPARGRAVSLPM